MDVIAAIFGTAISFAFLFLVFRPLEYCFPAKKGQRFFRPAWWTDLCFFLGQYLLWNAIVIWLLHHFGHWLGSIIPAAFRNTVSHQRLFLQAVEVILISDFCVYWGHRLQHRSPFLWRFHSIHHSAEHLDWLAAHREHPIDSVYTIGLINLPVFILGFGLEPLAALVAFRGIWAIYIHSNVRLPIGPLRILIGAPELHHWHHDRNRQAGNYANISPIMDILFGTYRCPNQEPESFGIDEPISRSYLGQMLHPFRRRNKQSPLANPAQKSLASSPEDDKELNFSDAPIFESPK